MSYGIQYSTHAQRNEQKHQKTYPFKGTQKSTSRRRTKTQRRHTLHGPCRLHDKAAKEKHTDITPSATPNMPRWQSPLLFILSTGPISSCPLASIRSKSNLKSPASAAYLNSVYPEPFHPCGQWPSPQTTGTGRRTNATGRKRVRPKPRCLHAAHLTQRKNTAVQNSVRTTPARRSQMRRCPPEPMTNRPRRRAPVDIQGGPKKSWHNPLSILHSQRTLGQCQSPFMSFAVFVWSISASSRVQTVVMLLFHLPGQDTCL